MYKHGDVESSENEKKGRSDLGLLGQCSFLPCV
jgi:hypothetical protein